MFIATLLAAATSSADLSQYFEIADRNVGIVEDAKKRVLEKSNEKQLDLYTPMVIYMFGERCVHLFLDPNYTGGSPTYCYEMREDKLTRADDALQ